MTHVHVQWGKIFNKVSNSLSNYKIGLQQVMTKLDLLWYV